MDEKAGGMKSKYLTIGVVIFLVVTAMVLVISKNKKKENQPLPTPIPSATVSGVENGLKIEDVVVGTGAEAVAGKKVTVNYLGTLVDGTKFDSSYDRGVPFSFNLGAGEVIKGWDEGVAGMKIGGKRKLTIPSELGYGAAGAGEVIPPNAIFNFRSRTFGS